MSTCQIACLTKLLSHTSTSGGADNPVVQAVPGEAYRMLDKGPAPDTPEAAAFRDFWGDKAELRRFQVLLLVWTWREVMPFSEKCSESMPAGIVVSQWLPFSLAHLRGNFALRSFRCVCSNISGQQRANV